MAYNGKYQGKEIDNMLDLVPGKQDKISDLSAIRSGAALGATAVQPSVLDDWRAVVSAAIASFDERLPK